ncbi:Uncharacterised protein [Chlamydia trachomatis]|nr:Uncharacterised protein [Chlamydia trachomatis]
MSLKASSPEILAEEAEDFSTCWSRFPPLCNVLKKCSSSVVKTSWICVTDAESSGYASPITSTSEGTTSARKGRLNPKRFP